MVQAGLTVSEALGMVLGRAVAKPRQYADFSGLCCYSETPRGYWWTLVGAWRACGSLDKAPSRTNISRCSTTVQNFGFFGGGTGL
jgi:hypothetical protein